MVAWQDDGHAGAGPFAQAQGATSEEEERMRNCLVMGAAGCGGFLSGAPGIADGALVMSCEHEERVNA